MTTLSPRPRLGISEGEVAEEGHPLAHLLNLSFALPRPLLGLSEGEMPEGGHPLPHRLLYMSVT